MACSGNLAAQATRLSRDLLYDEMRAGRLAYLKVGRRRIITRQHPDAFHPACLLSYPQAPRLSHETTIRAAQLCTAYPD